MKREFKLLFFSLMCVFGLCTLTSSKVKKKSRKYRFSAKYDHSTLELFEDGSFYQRKSSCTYGFTAKGTWAQDGDTIYLNRSKLKGSTAYVDHSLKIFMKSPDSLIYTWDLNFGLNYWMILSEE